MSRENNMDYTFCRRHFYPIVKCPNAYSVYVSIPRIRRKVPSYPCRYCPIADFNDFYCCAKTRWDVCFEIPCHFSLPLTTLIPWGNKISAVTFLASHVDSILIVMLDSLLGSWGSEKGERVRVIDIGERGTLSFSEDWGGATCSLGRAVETAKTAKENAMADIAAIIVLLYVDDTFQLWYGRVHYKNVFFDTPLAISWTLRLAREYSSLSRATENTYCWSTNQITPCGC